jgi:hypothetical protein
VTGDDDDDEDEDIKEEERNKRVKMGKEIFLRHDSFILQFMLRLLSNPLAYTSSAM